MDFHGCNEKLKNKTIQTVEFKLHERSGISKVKFPTFKTEPRRGESILSKFGPRRQDVAHIRAQSREKKTSDDR